MKERLDVLLVQRGHAASREKAKAVIMAGCVYVNGQKEDKAGSMFDCAAEIEVRGNTLRYVSRGGLKLEKAMKNFGVELEEKVCMDVLPESKASISMITELLAEMRLDRFVCFLK